MSRGFASANVTASQSAHVRPVDFCEAAFDSGVVRVHNGAGTIPWGGHDWTGIGGFLSMGPIEEGEDGVARSFWVRLNAFDDAILAEALAQEVYKRPVKIYTGFLGDDGALVADPHDSMWAGFGDSTLIRYGEDNYVVLECELEVALDYTSNGSRFTDEDQQKRYPGDTGFQYLDQMIDSRVHWGPGGQSLVLGVSSGPGVGPGEPRTRDRTRRTQ